MEEEEVTCEDCKSFLNLDDPVVTFSYGFCRLSGFAVYKDDKKRQRWKFLEEYENVKEKEV